MPGLLARWRAALAARRAERVHEDLELLAELEARLLDEATLAGRLRQYAEEDYCRAQAVALRRLIRRGLP